MLDTNTIPKVGKMSLLVLVGYLIVASVVVFLLCVCALLCQLALFLLQVISTTAHEFIRLYGLQPSLLQLALLVVLVVLVVWFLARCLRSLLRAGAFIKDQWIDEALRRAYRRSQGGRNYGH